MQVYFDHTISLLLLNLMVVAPARADFLLSWKQEPASLALMNGEDVLWKFNAKRGIDVFGKGWGSFKIAHLSTGDKIGVEMFEFQNNEKPKDFEYWKTGTFHFCIQDPNIESLVEKIVANGGKQRMPIREYYPDEKPFKMVYVEDPFGLVFEIYTHSYELTYSQGAY